VVRWMENNRTLDQFLGQVLASISTLKTSTK
jgi:hypothetical protein